MIWTMKTDSGALIQVSHDVEDGEPVIILRCNTYTGIKQHFGSAVLYPSRVPLNQRASWLKQRLDKAIQMTEKGKQNGKTN